MLDKCIFYPRESHSELSKKWKDCELTINLNNQKLQGWLIENKEQKLSETAPFIIYYGGNAEDVLLNLFSWRDPAWRIHASSFLLMNYRGYGGSSGKPTQKGLLEDALAIYDHVVQNFHIPAEQICLMGRSIGSCIASYVASQRKVGGLILVTPFDSVENVVNRLFKWLPVGWLFRNSYNTSQYLSQVNCKMLVLEAEQDEIIPKECLEALVTKYQSQISLSVIKGADHQDIGEYDEYYSAINQYLGMKPCFSEKNITK